ncbi:hypothetical protein [Microvirga sp. TS319]|uniref:hypothetical protein n=1 Tax=Microvirga sp. TS319 TaxID=3241165 RepID=UPI00351A2C4E
MRLHEALHLMIGRKPRDAGVDRRGDRTGLKMLILREDATREYAYGPAQDLPDRTVGTFSPGFYDEAAKKDGWTVIGMQNDGRRIFAVEQ